MMISQLSGATAPNTQPKADQQQQNCSTASGPPSGVGYRPSSVRCATTPTCAAAELALSSSRVNSAAKPSGTARARKARLLGIVRAAADVTAGRQEGVRT